MISLEELPKLYSDVSLEQEKPAHALRVCVIALGEETFAIDLRQVLEAFKPNSITPVPGMPDAIVGVTNLRGAIVPLADLRRALGVSVSAIPKYAVVVRHNTHQIGILVEDVPEIRTLHSDDLMTPSAHFTTKKHPMISLFFKPANKPIGILEMSRLLSSIEEETATERSS